MANKIFLIIGREYFTRVKKKSFLLTTILIPIVIMAFYIGIIAIAVSDSGSKNINGLDQIAIIDKAGLFNGKVSGLARDDSWRTKGYPQDRRIRPRITGDPKQH